MGLLTCCFSSQGPAARPQPAYQFPEKPCDLSHTGAAQAVPSENQQRASTDVRIPFDVGQLQALQLALGALEGDGFEARAPLFASTVQEHLGPTAVARLFALTPDDSDPNTKHLVQLAARAGMTVAATQCAENCLPGRSFQLSAAIGAEQADSAMSGIPLRSMASRNGERRGDPLLMEQALASKKAAVCRFERAWIASGDKVAGAVTNPMPRDCAADVATIRGSAPLTFAALPLTSGRRLMGALWIVIAECDPTTANGAGGWDDRAALVNRSLALLNDASALAQLSLSASMALAAAVDSNYVAWLAGAVRRLAGCTNLHTLVAGVCSAVSKHVRLRFHADVVVQSALVPEPESHVAFMLCPETAASTALPSGSLAAVRNVTVAAIAEDDRTAQRPRSGVVMSLRRKPVRRVASQTGVQHPPTHVAADSEGGRSLPPQPPAGSMPSQYAEQHRRRDPDDTSAGAGRHVTSAYGDRDVTDGVIASPRSLGPDSAAATSAVLFLSAKAFQLSHTLLFRLVTAARIKRRQAQVPAGIIVADTARHIADVRQPSRDVCMLIGFKNSMPGTSWQASAAAGIHNLDSSSRNGTSSLVLLGMEVAEGGCMLGLYVAFPTLMPQPLLSAVRDSCGALMNKMLVDVVRHQLQSAELGADFETLRAGVPGSYMSVSRVREHVDQLQLPLTPAATLVQAHRDSNWNIVVRAASWTSNVNARIGSHLAAQEAQGETVMGGCAAEPVLGSGVVSGLPRNFDTGGEDARRKYSVPPSPPSKQLLLASASSRSCRPSAFMDSSLTPSAPHAAATAPSSGCTQRAGALLMPSGMGGLPSGRGGASPGAWAAAMLDSTLDLTPDERYAPAAMMTVHDLDEAWGMRGMMGALVESIMTTLRASVSKVAESAHGPDLGARAVEGLEDLHLANVLGHGAGGVVFRGLLGTVPVAVKMMEMLDADHDVLSTEVCLAQGPRVHLTQPQHELVHSLAPMMRCVPDAKGIAQQQQQQRCDSGEGQARPQGSPQVHPTESEQVRARRNMLHNATELAVMRSVSHVCIVQAFAVYDNVVMERSHDSVDGFVLRRLDPKNHPQTGGSPICTAIVQELCDCGSLADALADSHFPMLVTRQQQSGPWVSPQRGDKNAGRAEVDMKGVYLTLLEVALALRHLHARRLVHRDVKPGNILLKTSPGDPRGWTCKLADFGFALVLDQQDAAVAETKDADSGIVPSALAKPVWPGQAAGGSAAGAARGWYTVQAQAGGTVTHMAPEAVFKNSRIDSSVDVYALGVIFWELVCGRSQRPFCQLDPNDIPAAVLSGTRPMFTGDVPEAYRKMAQACWAQEAHRRPRITDVISFIKSQLMMLN